MNGNNFLHCFSSPTSRLSPTQFCSECCCRCNICELLPSSCYARSPKPQVVAFFWNVLPLFSVSGMFFLFCLCSQVLSIFQGTSPTSPLSLLLTSPRCHCHFNYVFSSVKAFAFPSCFVSIWILRKTILFGISQFAYSTVQCSLRD